MILHDTACKILHVLGRHLDTRAPRTGCSSLEKPSTASRSLLLWRAWGDPATRVKIGGRSPSLPSRKVLKNWDSSYLQTRTSMRGRVRMHSRLSTEPCAHSLQGKGCELYAWRWSRACRPWQLAHWNLQERRSEERSNRKWPGLRAFRATNMMAAVCVPEASGQMAKQRAKSHQTPAQHRVMRVRSEQARVFVASSGSRCQGFGRGVLAASSNIELGRVRNSKPYCAVLISNPPPPPEQLCNRNGGVLNVWFGTPLRSCHVSKVFSSLKA